MQTRNRLFDDLAKVANSAVGTVTGMKDEVEQMIRHRVENFIGGMNLVTREEFDVVQAMIVKSREEQEQQRDRDAGPGPHDEDAAGHASRPTGR